MINKDIVQRGSGEFLRGRFFSSKEIQLIAQIVKVNYDNGRTRASVEICKRLDWMQPNGWLKDRACRDVLRILEQKGYFELPPRKNSSSNATRIITSKVTPLCVNETQITSIDFAALKLIQVKGQARESLWNELVCKYHYLGFNVFVGRSLKYLVFLKDRVIAAIGWCDPAWAVGSRDSILSKIGICNQEARLRGINNGRFLIMPWVKVPNLASYLLALSSKILTKEWSDYYSVKPLFLETFVDSSLFNGTCYKAANWILVGRSKGYRKIGSRHSNSQTQKLVFVYPVNRRLRKQMLQAIEKGLDAVSNI